MKKVFTLALSISILVACGEKKEEAIKFESEKQKLSYALGADFAGPIVGAGQEASVLDLEAVANGFETALNEDDYSACQQTIIESFGMNFSSPDSTKRIPGSECFGKMNGSRLYSILKEIDQVKAFDLKYVAYGYRDALMKRDTILDKGERASLLTKFQTEVQTTQMNKMKQMDQPFLDKAKSLPNTRVIEGGIVIETVQEGKGASPNMTDDVSAHYILTNTIGDTVESSFDRGEPLGINLQQVIPGWTMSFPQLKKGGKYRLYIPSELAYQNGALCFYIELVDFGAAGKFSQR